MASKELKKYFYYTPVNFQGTLITVSSVRVSRFGHCTHLPGAFFPSDKANAVIEQVNADTKPFASIWAARPSSIAHCTRTVLA